MTRKNRGRKKEGKNYSRYNPIGKSRKIIKNKSRNHRTSYEKKNQIYLKFMMINYELVYSY